MAEYFQMGDILMIFVMGVLGLTMAFFGICMFLVMGCRQGIVGGARSSDGHVV